MKHRSVNLSWLAKAEDDLRWTEANIREEIHYGACFTAQQAAEKALKAFLLENAAQARKIHDLGAILEECIVIDGSFLSLRETILPLVDYYIQTRYPDASEFMQYTKEKAEDALKRAQQVVNFVKQKLP